MTYNVLSGTLSLYTTTTSGEWTAVQSIQDQSSIAPHSSPAREVFDRRQCRYSGCRGAILRHQVA